MEYYFETRDLAVGYHGKPLIENISVRFGRGEIVTLIGPNGSGKSTILKSITRHLPMIAGGVWIGRNELGKLSYAELSRQVAVVLTERIRPELMTCRDVVATGRYPYTGRMGILREKDEKLVNDAMEKVHVLELANTDFSDISDGQRQRVLLARAICQEPEIIVLDEPTSFLDIRHKVELLELLREMAKENGTTVIMSLHEIDLAAKVSDRILCVDGKQIAAFGTPEEIFAGDRIHELYGIEPENYNTRFGSVELPAVRGEAETFVISSCGTGIPVYRRLQKMGIPFYAGILYSNDVDCELARALAAHVVEEEPFEEIRQETFAEAVRLMKNCRKVIVCETKIGTCNRKLEELIRVARETKDLVVEEAWLTGQRVGE
jgi:iron complex transport system ATP-binding protein